MKTCTCTILPPHFFNFSNSATLGVVIKIYSPPPSKKGGVRTMGTDVYIPNHKHQVKPHLSPSFSAACAAAIIHRNHFLCLYQQNKSSESKVKFRQASNCCKRVLEAVKLAYANKTKESTTSQKLGSHDFLENCQ